MGNFKRKLRCFKFEEGSVPFFSVHVIYFYSYNMLETAIKLNLFCIIDSDLLYSVLLLSENPKGR